MPGPANYERKRMFDNKQAIDYTKRFQTSMQMGCYNTASVGFPAAHGATNTDGMSSIGGVLRAADSGHTWNDSKPVIEKIIESPQQRKLSHRALATNAGIKPSHHNNHKGFAKHQYSSMQNT